MKKNLFNKIIPYVILTGICIGSVMVCLPAIGRNVDDPDLIAYFNHDEGYLMDLIWYYYSGEKRDSFQYDRDYGLEMLYLSDASRIVLSEFINFTPGIFILILRWLHLIFWIASLLALWRLIKYHFGGNWESLLLVALLAVRPAFPYLLGCSKPESMVLFFMIIGIDYTLRIVDKPDRINLYVALSCASVAFIVKYAGIFLLPSIVISLYLAEQLRENHEDLFPRFRAAWLFPSMAGLILVILPLLPIFFYVRRTTGFTWYEEFGFWGSLSHNKVMILSIIIGVLFIMSSIIIWIFANSSNFKFKKVINRVNDMISLNFFVLFLFMVFTIIFGFRWIINPRHFLDIYAMAVPDATGHIKEILYENGLIVATLKHFIEKIGEFDYMIFISFISYLIIEISLRKETLKSDRLIFFKRLTLMGLLLPFVIYIFSMWRMANHHMLPFFAACIVLVSQGVKIFYNTFLYKRAWVRNLTFCLIGLFIAANIIKNGRASAESFISLNNQHEDVVFDIAEWWQKKYPPDTSIISDHPTRVYLPPEYKNVRFLTLAQRDSVDQISNLVKTFKPQLIYYNTLLGNSSEMPPIEEILPDISVELVASFDNEGKGYKRHLRARYVVYEVLSYSSSTGK